MTPDKLHELASLIWSYAVVLEQTDHDIQVESAIKSCATKLHDIARLRSEDRPVPSELTR